MMPRDVSFIVMVFVVVSGLYLLSFVGKAKELPDDERHFAVSERSQCLSCHSLEKMAALEQIQKHPARWRKEQNQLLVLSQRRQIGSENCCRFPQIIEVKNT